MENTDVETRMTIHDRDKIQFYSAATANGLKVAVALEEIVEERKLKGDCPAVNYEPHTVKIRCAENHQPFFANFCITQKIPIIVDPHGAASAEGAHVPIKIFESGAILLYLAEKYGDLIPQDTINRYNAIQWCFWGSSELSVQCKLFGFYYKYCTHKLDYCTERARNKVLHLLEVLERQLQSHGKHFIVGDQYTIADISAWPWVWALKENYDDALERKFGGLTQFPLVKVWFNRCASRPASARAMLVCPFLDEHTSKHSTAHQKATAALEAEAAREVDAKYKVKGMGM